ncbi:MAG: glycosyltransferase family 4 protein [Bellilinea sp.]
MKMLISYLYCNQGGVTSVIKQRMPVLLRNGWSVDAAFIADHGGKYDLLNAGVNNVYIFSNNLKQNINRLMETNQYDLHVNFDSPTMLQVVDKKEKPRVIFEVHTPILKTIMNYPSNVLNLCDAIFVPSSWSKKTVHQLLPSLPSEMVKVIPNIVDSEVFNNKGVSYSLPQILIWVGKLADYKNWEEAMKIGAAFLKLHPSWFFFAVTGGQTSDRNVSRMLYEFIERDQIKQFSWFHNLKQNEIAKIYRGVSRGGGFLLSSSKAESFCLVIHEAIRCGIPIISTRVGPIPDIIEDQVNGLLYDQGNIVECLEKCELYLDPAFREVISNSAIDTLAHFDQSSLENILIDEVNKAMGL